MLNYVLLSSKQEYVSLFYFRQYLFLQTLLFIFMCLLRQECCQCCSLGVIAQSARLPCNLMNRYSTQCGTSFTECCEGTVLQTTVGPTTNRSSVTIPTLVPIINGKYAAVACRMRSPM